MHDSGNRKEFAGGGMRDTAEGKERFELLWTSDQPYEDQLLTRMARWMARGAEKYEDRNWEQFDGPDAEEHAKASLLRHVFKFLSGKVDEDHAAAVVFNVQAIELVRWKQNGGLEKKQFPESWTDIGHTTDGIVVGQAKVYLAPFLGSTPEPENTAAARYFLDRDGWYYRLLDTVFTYVISERSGRDFSHCDGPDDYRLQTVKEVPVNEVPEWAR